MAKERKKYTNKDIELILDSVISLGIIDLEDLSEFYPYLITKEKKEKIKSHNPFLGKTNSFDSITKEVILKLKKDNNE